MHLDKKKSQFLIPILIFLLAFSWRLWGINAAGETWDEIAYYNAAKQYLINIKDGDFNADHWIINKEHPPVAKYILGIVSIKPFLEDKTDYTNGRVVSALMGALTILLVYLIGKDLFSKRVGILSALILTFIPYFVGYNKVYGLDTPTVLFFTLTIWLFLRAVLNNSNYYYFLSAISLGLALGTRLNNLLLYPMLLTILLIIKGKDFWQGRDRKYLWHIFTFILVPALVFFISWPWLWSNTKNHLDITIGHWSQVTEIYFGKNISAPMNYYFVYFLVSTPVLLLLLIIPFLISLIKTNNKKLWILLFWLLIPFLWTFAVIRQDGVRYILIIYPALALICGYVIGTIKNIKLFWFSSIIVIGYLLFVNIKIHPYYIDYYNEIAKGPKTIYNNKWFQLGWWGEGIEEATSWLNKNAAQGASIVYLVVPDHTKGKLREDLKIDSNNSDYVVINTNSEWYKDVVVDQNKYTLVYQVMADNAPIAKIYRKKND